MSESSGSPSSHNDFETSKRKFSQTGLDGTSTARSMKRRASKACQCCRNRKVRCNVTEHGAPCTNCRLDEVECIVSESRRKKKWNKDDEHRPETTIQVMNANRKLASRRASHTQPTRPIALRESHDIERQHGEHVPHTIYQNHSGRPNSITSLSELQRRFSAASQVTGALRTLPFTPFANHGGNTFFGNSPTQNTTVELPRFIKPLPARIGAEEISYLQKKGALTIPRGVLRSEILRAYIDFVHPYMPLLDLHEFLTTIDRGDGSAGTVSLILFQAVMFAGSAFIDMQFLRNAGYATRKKARRDFFQKSKILYDFDYESDRVSLVQALLLLTYYYETPDDQKDTWHWMGVATSVAHTIGLHRNPAATNMDEKRIKLWKRIWWSTYMRDRLIALGMRRPTRIKSEDFDVPMLSLDDFEIAPIPDSITCIPADCRVARDVNVQRELAIMCIEKAKLCLCISHVLSAQYCVLNSNQGISNDRTTMMLLPKKLDPSAGEVKVCDDELQQWVAGLPMEARYMENWSGDAAIDLSRSLLHMVFFTTLSALHRPQVLPNSATSMPVKSDIDAGLLDVSRRNVRRAASAITSIAQRLDAAGLVKYMPTTGVTVLLPAIIIHLLDIKAPEEETRRSSLRGFCQCMAVMGKLRDLYAAADYSVAFLEAAIRKAGIQVSPLHNGAPIITTVEDLIDAGRRLDPANYTNAGPPYPQETVLTPPPDDGTTTMFALEKSANEPDVTDAEVARRLENFLASTPPDSDHENMPKITLPNEATLAPSLAASSTPFNEWSSMTLPQDSLMNINHHQDNENLFSSLPLNNEYDDGDFDSLLNLDAVGETFTFDDGAGQMDWLIDTDTTLTVEA